MKNYRITYDGERVVALGGYVGSADAARLTPVTYQRIGQLGAELGRVESNGSVYVKVAELAARWPEAAAEWRWFNLYGDGERSPLWVQRE